MTQYTLAAGEWTAATLPKMVGGTYNIGLSDGTHYYGYLFQNQGAQAPGMVEKNDVNTRTALTSYGSPNLVDRDLVYFPRVSQGDFSGGGLQIVFIDPTRYFDSDLEIRFPSYLQLRQTVTDTSYSVTNPTTNSIVAFNGQYWASAGESNFQFYNFDTSATLTTNTAGIVVKYLNTDGYGVYYSNGSSIRRWISSEVTIANTVNGTAGNLWVIQNGTGQYFAYYVDTAATPNALWKVDLSNSASFPIAAAAHVQVPTGGMNLRFIDIVAYENGLAILTDDAAGTLGTTGVSGQVWFHDGLNMTKIVSLQGYLPRGMVNCLGDLFVTADQRGSPGGGAILAKVSGGVYSIAADVSPALTLTTSGTIISKPTVSDSRVYFVMLNSTLGGIAGNYVGIFDTATGAYSHGPALPTVNGTVRITDRAVTAVGSSIGTILPVGAAPTQIALDTQPLNGTAVYQASGWMVSSNFDFSTPAIEKRFRTIEVHHAPLNAGESILVNAYLDQDPTAFSTALTATATTTNSTLASTTTTLSLGPNVSPGHMMYFAIKVSAGTSNLTTPRVNYVTVEVGGTWSWDLLLDCTFKRRTLGEQGQLDPQGVTGKDLYFLLRNAVENGTLLTLYLAESVSYTVTIESLEGDNASYFDKPNNDGGPVNADAEWLVKVLLRQVA